MIPLDRAREAAPKTSKLAPELGTFERLKGLGVSFRQATSEDSRSFSQLEIFLVAFVAHAPADFIFVCLSELGDREHVSVAFALDYVFCDPLELLEELLANHCPKHTLHATYVAIVVGES